MTRPTLAFVDHSFHKKTHSGDFLREIFSKDFEITDYWDEAWRGGDHVSVNDINQHDYVFYFQSLTPLNELQNVTAKMIWAPMEDGTDFSLKIWMSLSKYDIKIFAFSEKIYKYARLYGFPTLRLQYYLEPTNLKISNNKKVKIYFWYRGAISVNEIVRHINKNHVSEFVIRSLPDPGYDHEIISKQLISDYHMKVIIAKSFDKEEHLKLLHKADVFICPRKSEGIGMANLEAIAAGKCLIGWDQATMNEYITHEVSGFLFNIKTKTIDLSKWRDRTVISQRLAVDGYQSWIKNSKRITDFCVGDHKKTGINIRIYILIYFIYFKRVVLSTIKKHKNISR